MTSALPFLAVMVCLLCTVADNRVTNGGGGVVGSVTISNTILARNAGGNCASVTLRDLGYTLSNDATCMLPGTGSMT